MVPSGNTLVLMYIWPTLVLSGSLSTLARPKPMWVRVLGGWCSRFMFHVWLLASTAGAAEFASRDVKASAVTFRVEWTPKTVKKKKLLLFKPILRCRSLVTRLAIQIHTYQKRPGCSISPARRFWQNTLERVILFVVVEEEGRKKNCLRREEEERKNGACLQ